MSTSYQCGRCRRWSPEFDDLIPDSISGWAWSFLHTARSRACRNVRARRVYKLMWRVYDALAPRGES